MKSKTLFFFLFLSNVLFYQKVSAQWQPVGPVNFSPGSVSFTSLALDKTGMPYLAFQDKSSTLYKASVMKFTDTGWAYVGPPRFSVAEADYISLAIDSSTGNLYVAYEDFGNGPGGLTVRKFNGTNWDTLGTSDFAPGDVNFVSLAVFNDTPYVAFEDFADSAKVSVMKYTGTGWVNLGNRGISAGKAEYISLAIDHNGKPYVGYEDKSTASDYATVMTLTDTTWVPVGSGSISPGGARFISMAIGNFNTPYMAYSDNAATTANSVSVMQFNGGNWIFMGVEGFNRNGADYVSMLIDKNETPYIIYSDAALEGKASVMYFNDSRWDYVGQRAFSAGLADFTRIAIDSQGTVYAGYADHGNASGATVMEYSTNTGINETAIVESVDAFPNPGTGMFSIKMQTAQPDEVQLSVYDITGRIIWQNTPVEVNRDYATEINLSPAAPAIYFLRIKGGAGVKTIKLGVQR